MAFNNNIIMSLPPSAIVIGVFAMVVTDYFFNVPHVMTAAISLILGTLCLNLFGFLVFDVFLGQWYYPVWIAKERNMTMAQIQTQVVSATTPESKSRIALYVCVEICGHLGLLLYLGSQFQLLTTTTTTTTFNDVSQAIITAVVLYVVTVLPHIHHFLWEDRQSWTLIMVVELYQLVRRIIAACTLVYFSQWANEELKGTILVDLFHSFHSNNNNIDDDDNNKTTILFQPSFGSNGNNHNNNIQTLWKTLVIMTIIRFVLEFLWYGPIFSKVWLHALRQFKNNDKHRPDGQHMPYFILAGTLLGLFQNFFLLQLYTPLLQHLQQQQTTTATTSTLEMSLRAAFYLWFFYMLPSASTDLLEGKPIELPLLEHFLHLVEICLLFGIHSVVVMV